MNKAAVIMALLVIASIGLAGCSTDYIVIRESQGDGNNGTLVKVLNQPGTTQTFIEEYIEE